MEVLSRQIKILKRAKEEIGCHNWESKVKIEEKQIPTSELPGPLQRQTAGESNKGDGVIETIFPRVVDNNEAISIY